MPKFMLLPREIPPDFSDVSPAEMQAIIEKYVAWGQRIRDAGKLVDSNKLRDGEGKVVRAANGRMSVTDGPFSETKEVIGGYWVVQADDYEDAVALCADHPHLEFGSSLEVRAIEEM